MLDPVERAALEAIVYADVFDWPLTPLEVHRYLPIPAAAAAVAAALAALAAASVVVTRDDLVMLAGRESLADERRRRAAASERLWRAAAAYGRVVASLPWVRLVAVTGSLAVGAASDDADIDLLVVATDERLWLTRALTIAVVRAAAGRDVTLCPNYFLARSAVALPERDRFTAHELAQMVPIAGAEAYRTLLDRNPWYREFLPNHPGQVLTVDADRTRPIAPSIRRVAERAFRGRLGDGLERWEMARKIRRLTAGPASGEVRFGPAVCKGHVTEHRRRALASFDERLDAVLGRLG
ncbi:MAG: hypothetical protein IVW53_12290 [Chloroflexi bacterium]|nr:hypothetical protein [Chloroflexota bacterium]